MERLGIIYMLLNRKNAKAYIGKTIDFINRIRDHKRAKHDFPIHCAIRKHKWESFEVIKLFEEVSQDVIDDLEIYCIAQYNTIAPNGYNLKEGGDGGPIAESTKEKISIALKEYYSTNPTRTNRGGGGASGWKHDKETRERMSQAQRARVADPNYRNPNLGKPNSEKQKKQISESLTGRFVWEKNSNYGTHIDPQKLRSWRESNGYTRKQLAELVGCGRTSIENWENGYRVSRKARLKFQSALGFDPEEVFK